MSRTYIVNQSKHSLSEHQLIIMFVKKDGKRLGYRADQTVSTDRKQNKYRDNVKATLFSIDL